MSPPENASGKAIAMTTPPHSNTPPSRGDSLSPPQASPHDTDQPSTAKPSPAGAGNSLHLKPGEQPVPDYVLKRKLGKGGFGEVWQATGPGGFDVALKFVPLGDHAGAVEERSLTLMKSIRHAHLLHQFGAWQRDGHLIIAMELGDRTLLDRLKEAVNQGLSGIPAEELLEYLREAAKGLDYLNEQHNVQHRDVKPANFLLVGGSVKVADFGLAKLLEHTVSTGTGGMTPAYAAPEFFRSEVSRWSDQYSLAVSYCHLRGNRLPFAGNFAGIMRGHLDKPPDLTMLPVAEQPVVARALAKRPAQRWPDCRSFVEALAAGIGAPGPLTTVLTHAGKPPVPSRWGKPRATAALALLGLLVLALLALRFWPVSRPEAAAGLSPLPAEAPAARTDDHVRPATLAGSLPRKVTNTLAMKFVLLPPGTFLMGSPLGEKGRYSSETLHPVELTRPYYLGVHVVTVGQFGRFVAATGYKTEAETDPWGGQGYNPATRRFERGKREYTWRGAGWGQTDAHPVVNVTWNDATEFCEWLSRKEGKTYRLPTEAEWEYACRAGTTTRFWSGDAELSLQGVANLADASLQRLLADGELAETSFQPWDDGFPFTAPVGSYRPNAWGLYDMHGNVFQWCADWFGPYPPGAMQNPKGAEQGPRRVLRGGSCVVGPEMCRSAFRLLGDPNMHDWSSGFRVVLQ
jgi:formylglycine-generating enzyme required for sulfatase activity